MAIYPKPHERANKIKKTIFKGRPAIYSVQDINRRIDALQDFRDVHDHGSQILRENITAVVTAFSAYFLNPTYRINYNFQISKENAGQSAYIHVKGVSIPFETTQTFSGYIDVPNKYSELQLLMFAPIERKTFSQDETLCGVTSDVSSPQESCEVDVYGTPTFILTGSDNASTVITNNNSLDYLGVIASIPITERVSEVTGVVSIDSSLFFDAGNIEHSHATDKFDYSSAGIFSSVRNSIRSLVLKSLERIEYLYSFATYADAELNRKVDSISGYGLSEEDFTTALLSKLNGVATNANNYTHPTSHPISFITGLETALNGKASSSHEHTYLRDATDVRIGTPIRVEGYTNEVFSIKASRIVMADISESDVGTDKSRMFKINSFARWNVFVGDSGAWNYGRGYTAILAGYDSSSYICAIEEYDSILIKYHASYRGSAGGVTGEIITRGIDRDSSNYLPTIDIGGTSYRIFIQYDDTNKRLTAYGYDSSPTSPKTIIGIFEITVIHAGSAGESYT